MAFLPYSIHISCTFAGLSVAFLFQTTLNIMPIYIHRFFKKSLIDYLKFNPYYGHFSITTISGPCLVYFSSLILKIVSIKLLVLFNFSSYKVLKKYSSIQCHTSLRCLNMNYNSKYLKIFVFTLNVNR